MLLMSVIDFAISLFLCYAYCWQQNSPAVIVELQDVFVNGNITFSFNFE